MRTAEGRLVVYTDGGCTSNGKMKAKAGLGVYYGARSGRNLSEPVPGLVQTNNRGELLVRNPRSRAPGDGISLPASHINCSFASQAILRALETAPEPTGPLEIRTDSRVRPHCLLLV